MAIGAGHGVVSDSNCVAVHEARIEEREGRVLAYSANGGGLPASGGFEEAGEVKEAKEIEEVEEEICHRCTQAPRNWRAERQGTTQDPA
jgi:hypothetical protein